MVAGGAIAATALGAEQRQKPQDGLCLIRVKVDPALSACADPPPAAHKSCAAKEIGLDRKRIERAMLRLISVRSM